MHMYVAMCMAMYVIDKMIDPILNENVNVIIFSAIICLTYVDILQNNISSQCSLVH